MGEWIKKSDAIDALYKYNFVTKEVIEREIMDIPSADRPRGEWRNIDGELVPLDEGGCPTESAWCSECGTWLVASDEYSVIGRFCPNCGAKMKGAEDDIDNV